MVRRLGILVFCLAIISTSVSGATWQDLVPEKVVFLVGIDFQKAFSSPYIKKMIDRSSAGESPEQKKATDAFSREIGFDPYKTVKMGFFFVGSFDEKNNKKGSNGALFFGSFDSKKILQSIQDDPQARKQTIVGKFQGLDYVKTAKYPSNLAVFLDAQTLAFGSEEVVTRILKMKKSKQGSLKSNSGFIAAAKSTAGNNAVWGVGFLSPFMKKHLRTNAQLAPLAALDELSFGFRFKTGLDFLLQGKIEKPDQMNSLLTTFNGLLATMKAVMGKTPGLGEVMKSLNVEGAGTKLKVSLKIDAGEMEKLGTQFQKTVGVAPR